MKRRILSLILTFVLVVGAIPLSALADEEAVVTSLTSLPLSTVSDKSLYEGKVSAEFTEADGEGIAFAGTDNSYYVAYFEDSKVVLNTLTSSGALGAAVATSETITTSDSYKLSVAFSNAGAVRVWVNDEVVLDYKFDPGTFTGDKLAVCGSDTNAAIMLEGNLELESIKGEPTYDYVSAPYTVSGSTTTDVLAYFKNRQITNGYIVCDYPTVHNTSTGPVFGLKVAEGASGTAGEGLSYYIYNVQKTDSKHRLMLCDLDWYNKYQSDTTQIGTNSNGKNNYILQRFVDADGQPVDTEFFKNNDTGTNGLIYSSANQVWGSPKVDFNIGKDKATIKYSNKSNNAQEVITRYDTAPIQGCYYGVHLKKNTVEAISISGFRAVNNEAEAIGLDMSRNVATLFSGKTTTLEATTYPSGSIINSGASITWYSNNEAVATVDASTGVVTAVAPGTATITACVDNHIFGTLVATGIVEVIGITDASISLGESITVNYYATLNENYKDVSKLKMKFTLNNVTTEVSGEVVNAESYEYKFALEGIAPQCMIDKIDAVLSYDGEIIDSHEDFTIRQYCDAVLENIPDVANELETATQTLIADLLTYGAATQKYREHNPDVLATHGMTVTGSKFPELDASLAVSPTQGTNVKITAAGVWFGNVNKVYFKFTTSDLEKTTVTIDGVICETSSFKSLGDSQYMVYTDAIYPSEFGTGKEFQVTCGGDTAKINYCVNNYVYAMQEHEAASELVKTLYNYGASASAYLEGLTTTSLRRAVVSSVTEDNYVSYSYETMVEISYNENHKGTLIATHAGLYNSSYNGYPIYRSVDCGRSWNQISEAVCTYMEDGWEKIDDSYLQPCLYELPGRIGDYPAGTLILGGCTRGTGTDGNSKTAVTLYVSTDGGYTWTSGYNITTGGGDSDNDYTGVWEPYFIYENGTLYCFYSRQTNDNGIMSQDIVFKTTTDMVEWSDDTKVIDGDACGSTVYKPGMVSIAKMDNCTNVQYYMTYEVLYDEQSSNYIYYKTSNNLSSWTHTQIGTKIQTEDGYTLGSSPWCAWSPEGGDCGTLVIAAHHMKDKNYKTSDTTSLFVSYDYGETYVAIDNPIPHIKIASELLDKVKDDKTGYSPFVGFSADGKTFYYLNNPLDATGYIQQVVFARIGIEDLE